MNKKRFFRWLEKVEWRDRCPHNSDRTTEPGNEIQTVLIFHIFTKWGQDPAKLLKLFAVGARLKRAPVPPSKFLTPALPRPQVLNFFFFFWCGVYNLFYGTPNWTHQMLSHFVHGLRPGLPRPLSPHLVGAENWIQLSWHHNLRILTSAVHVQLAFERQSIHPLSRNWHYSDCEDGAAQVPVWNLGRDAGFTSPLSLRFLLLTLFCREA